MLRSQHPHDRDLLMALDGELARRRQAVVDEHVSKCVNCRSRLHQIRTTLAEASGVYESAFEPPGSPFPSSRARLERALEEAADEWDHSWLVRLRCTLALSPTRAGLCAAVVLAVLAVVSISRSDRIVRGTNPGFGTPLPIATLTPGGVSSLTAVELCAGARPPRLVTAASRERVRRDYHIEDVSTRAYELDALITPELGGTTEPENLWPQRYESPVWNARVKDELEQLLPRLVCSHQVALALAQREIATDWIAAYKRYFRTDLPLQAHVGTPVADEDDLEFAPVRYVAENSTPLVLNIRLVRP
jgi:hypothetical protein